MERILFDVTAFESVAAFLGGIALLAVVVAAILLGYVATIFAKEDPGDSVDLVKEGLVKLFSVSEKGAETIVFLFKPGEIFGELIISEEKRAFSAVAATNLVTAVVSRRNLVDLLSSVPALAANFIRLLSMRLAKVEREFAEFGHTWSHHRLAIVLLDLAREHGAVTRTGTKIPIRPPTRSWPSRSGRPARR